MSGVFTHPSRVRKVRAFIDDGPDACATVHAASKNSPRSRILRRSYCKAPPISCARDPTLLIGAARDAARQLDADMPV